MQRIRLARQSRPFVQFIGEKKGWTKDAKRNEDNRIEWITYENKSTSKLRIVLDTHTRYWKCTEGKKRFEEQKTSFLRVCAKLFLIVLLSRVQ